VCEKKSERHFDGRFGQKDCTRSFGLILWIFLSVKEQIFTSQNTPALQQFAILSFFD
jgi:hypothetical protein